MERAARTWGLWLCLALGVALAAWAVQVRDPAPADAPSATFSATRAMDDVRRVGAEPHPIGSAAADGVRAGLLARMTALGLDPQVREGVGLDLAKWAPDRLAAGEVRNLAGVVPGRDRTAPALLLMAHYDSVPNSPGAADDGAGVAAALEIARLLKATGPHARDVIVLLTDGEESGLLGADAFFREDPWARRVGAVVNLEARGDAGRAAMFETGPGNAETIRLYAATARAPFANSLTGFLYHQLPNDTDFTQAYRRGLPGLNFAFTGDQLAYHTPLATPDHLSQQSLQHMGDEAAPAVLALADASRLPARTADLAYFDVLGVGLVAYPPGWGWVLTLAGALLLGAAFVGAGRSDAEQRPTAGGVERGVAAAFTATLAAALVAHVAGRWLDGGGYVAGYRLYRAFDLLFAGVVLLVFGAALGVTAVSARGLGAGRLMAATLAVAVIGLPRGPDLVTGGLTLATLAGLAVLRRRPLGMWSGWLGAGVALGVVAVLLQTAAPLAAPLVEWPFLIAATTAALCAWTPSRMRALAFLAAGAAAVVLTAQLGALANGLFTAIGPSTPEVAAPFVLLLLPVLLPFTHAAAARRRTRVAAAAVVLLGAALTCAAALRPATSARPALTEAFYLVDASGAQRRVVRSPRLDAWSRAVLAPKGGRPGRETLEPLSTHPAWTSHAAPLALPAPRLSLTRAAGRVRLLAVPAAGGRSLRLFLRSPGALEDVRVQGRPSRMRGGPGRWALVSFDAPPPQGVTVDFAAAGAVEAQAFEMRDGWPPGAPAPAKPPGLMAFADSDTTIVGARAAIP